MEYICTLKKYEHITNFNNLSYFLLGNLVIAQIIFYTFHSPIRTFTVPRLTSHVLRLSPSYPDIKTPTLTPSGKVPWPSLLIILNFFCSNLWFDVLSHDFAPEMWWSLCTLMHSAEKLCLPTHAIWYLEFAILMRKSIKRFWNCAC